MKPDAQPRPWPLSLTVPIYNMTEVDLMGALDTLVSHFDNLQFIEKSRAVDWLYAKYGAANGD